jgi:hypothetical protein
LGLLLAAGAAAGAFACRSAAGSNGVAAAGEATAVRQSLEDVFLLSGELAAVRSVSIVTPRSEGPLQIRWMVEDGTDVAEGDRVLEFDAARVIQNIEERRLRLRQAENERESRERTLAADGDHKRVAVDKAEIEAEKAQVDAAVPRELRSAVEWRQMQATLLEKKAELQKARLDHQAFQVSSRSDLEVLRRAEEKVRREVEVAEQSLASMSVRAPRSGVFLISTSGNGDPRDRASSSRGTPSGRASAWPPYRIRARWRSRRPCPRWTTAGSRRA